MKIERISIQNFGILSDVVLDMSGPEGNLVFVNGQNGRGKTTFQSSLRWCFYGEEPNPGKFASRYALKNIKVGETITSRVSAEITLDELGGTASIERTQVFQKQPDGIPPKRIGAPNLIVKTKESDSAAMTDVLVNPEIWIGRYFPPRLLNFFLFDGEMMAKFFQTNVKGEIEKAIREIAGVDLFDAISQILVGIETSLNKKVSKLTGPKSEKIAADLEIERRLLAEIFAEYSQAKIDLSVKKSRISEVNTILSNSDNVQESANRLEVIDRKLDANQTALENAEKDFNALLLSSGTTSMLVPSFGELEIQVAEAKSEDRLPPPFDPARIQLLIDNGTCICGCDLSVDDARTEQLKRVIEKFKVSSDIGRLLDSASRESEKIVASLKSDWRAIEISNGNISRIDDESQTLRAERERLTVKLQGSDVETVRLLATERKSLDKDIERLIGDVAQLEMQADNAASKVTRLDKELQDSAKGNSEAEDLRNQAVMARKIANAASQIHEIAMKQVRSRLENEIANRFKVIKKGKFVTQITENFEVLTLHEDGTRVDLSEGESMGKAYIFSLALRDVINLGFPLIVDTPFGRLSEDFRAWLSEILSKFLEQEVKKSNRQIIFLMTDTEYTPYTKKHFSPLKPLEFYLAYEKENESDKSNLGQGIDPGWLEFTIWKAWHEGVIK